jgi:formamidopyrimidine-DNA glycosylase
MPELPEVETTRRGIESYIRDRTIAQVKIRRYHLRWPIDRRLPRLLAGNRIMSVGRRGKYLLLDTSNGNLIIHLGMSGSLRIVPADLAPAIHDHVDIAFADGRALRFRDPRRFGAILWCPDDPLRHPLLAGLGPEPWSEDFNADYLRGRAKGRRLAVKSFLMDAAIVVGVGNIYANEALFWAGIHPARAAGRVALGRYQELVAKVRQVLEAAIKEGGTTLRDFVNSRGEPGYFRHELAVYDRAGQGCVSCDTEIRLTRLGQRSTFYCPHCQH